MKNQKEIYSGDKHIKSKRKLLQHIENARKRKSIDELPIIFVISSYPPRECGIATFSKDLIRAMSHRYHKSFIPIICALKSADKNYGYDKNVHYILDTENPDSYEHILTAINSNVDNKMALLQHEFGLFNKTKRTFLEFLKQIEKSIITTLHTVLPNPNFLQLETIRSLASNSAKLIVMTNKSKSILVNHYGIDDFKIAVIPHGTHLLSFKDKNALRTKYGLGNRPILSTFGLLGPGKSIETSLNAMPKIINKFPEVLFLIIGRTHPSLVLDEGEKYRDFLKAKVQELGIEENVGFINKFVEISELLEYLQLSDIYMFTSKDPNQAVSGTFSYAVSCGCPVITTPIPHAVEVLEQKKCGLIVDFQIKRKNVLKAERDILEKTKENYVLSKKVTAKESQVNQLLSETVQHIQDKENLASKIKKVIAQEEGVDLKSILADLRISKLEDDKRIVFKDRIMSSSPEFLNRLKEVHPDLSKTDVEICSFEIAGLNRSEMANLRGTTMEAIKSNRYRLKKKLGLGPNSALKTYLEHL